MFKLIIKVWNRNRSFSKPAAVTKTTIPLKKTSFTFDNKVYRSDYLEGIVEQKDFNKIIEQCNRILGLAVEKKRENEEVKLPRFVTILTAVSVILSIIYIITVVLSAQDNNATPWLFFIGLICIISASAIAGGLSFYNFFRKLKKFKSLEEFMKEDLDDHLKGVNSNYLERCEFKFYLIKGGLIELNTFVKTKKMIEEESLFHKKTFTTSKDHNFDNTSSKDYSSGSVSREIDQTFFNINDDDSKIAIQAVQQLEIEMSSEKRGEKKKKFFGEFTKKQI